MKPFFNILPTHHRMAKYLQCNLYGTVKFLPDFAADQVRQQWPQLQGSLHATHLILSL